MRGDEILNYSEVRSIIMKLNKRSEKFSKDYLINTFVDSGTLIESLMNTDNQIIYGRRGTGKTHALNYLHGLVDQKGDICVSIDLRLIGSTAGIYQDNDSSLIERSTKLLVDTLELIHEELRSIIISRELMESNICNALNNLAVAITDIRIEGDVQISSQNKTATNDKLHSNMQLEATLSSILLQLGYSCDTEKTIENILTTIQSGKQKHHIHFGTLNKELRELAKLLNGIHVWILLDEWCSLPIDLQPFLADLLCRTFFPIQNITVKIATIEQKTCFKKQNADNSYIGFELTSDVSTPIDLDNIMVFNNNKDLSKAFFSKLIYYHIKANITEQNTVVNESELMKIIFKTQSAFEEFVKASEGVPRDAINILSLAVTDNNIDNIDIQKVRKYSKLWYTRSKSKDIINKQSKDLLIWIIDEVISHRKARAFLVPADTNDSLLNELFDARVLHILKDNISSKDKPGKRFIVYQIDYGCYVDLINTSNAPKGLFTVLNESNEEIYVDVPEDDYRAIRRAILNIDEFYNNQK